jgi:hypothetical protein
MEKKPRDNNHAEYAYAVTKRGFGGIEKYFISYNSSVAREHPYNREFYMERIKVHLRQVKAYLETEIVDELSEESVVCIGGTIT